MSSIGSLGEQLIATRSNGREKLRLAFLQSDPQVVLRVMDEIGAQKISESLGEDHIIWLGAPLERGPLECTAFIMDMVRHELPLDTRIGTSGWSPRTPLHFAVECGSIAQVRELLDRGADPNDYGLGDAHPLNVACSLRGKQTALALVEILLSRGSNPNGYDTHHTPLFLLASQNWVEPALLLLDHGAHGTVSTLSDQSVVEIARMKDNHQWADVVEAALVARRLDVNTPVQNKKSERRRL